MDELKISLSWVGPVGGRHPTASSGEQWGVWLYDDAWYDLSDDDHNQMRSYKFVLCATTSEALSTLLDLNPDMYGQIKFGTRSIDFKSRRAVMQRFYDTFVEVHFVATIILSAFLTGTDGHTIDLERIMSIHCPHLYREAQQRLTRLISDSAPDPDIIAGVGWYCDGREFLEYSAKDAYVLGGPIEYKGKKGAMATILDVLPEYAEEYAQGPWRVYIAGNDDLSWSKYLPSKEAAETELRYLRQMQPLHHKQDIIWRGYEFTN